MQKTNLSVAAFVLTVTGANAQLINGTGNSVVINSNTGAGTVVDQYYLGNSVFAPNEFAQQLWYSGTYANPRVDETAITVNGFATTFSTNSQPVELTSIDLIVDSGRTVNTGGPAFGSDEVSNISVNAYIEEVLGDGSMINTGYGRSLSGVLDGNGILDFSGENAYLGDNYILRPYTNYAISVTIADLMTFTNTANDPSMGVTQEFNNTGLGIVGDVQYVAAPDPSTIVGLGFGLLACLRRRRK